MYKTDNEIILYGTFCFPCLFGENQAKLKALQGEINPSCYPGCFSYIFMMLYGSLLGFTLATCLQLNAALITPCGDLCSRCTIGLYAGNNRTNMKTIINITNINACNDICLHTFCSPCAICEEAILINRYEHQNNNNNIMNLNPYIQDEYTNLTAPPLEEMNIDK